MSPNKKRRGGGIEKNPKKIRGGGIEKNPKKIRGGIEKKQEVTIEEQNATRVWASIAKPVDDETEEAFFPYEQETVDREPDCLYSSKRLRRHQGKVCSWNNGTNFIRRLLRLIETTLPVKADDATEGSFLHGVECVCAKYDQAVKDCPDQQAFEELAVNAFDYWLVTLQEAQVLALDNALEQNKVDTTDKLMNWRKESVLNEPSNHRVYKVRGLKDYLLTGKRFEGDAGDSADAGDSGDAPTVFVFMTDDGAHACPFGHLCTRDTWKTHVVRRFPEYTHKLPKGVLVTYRQGRELGELKRWLRHLSFVEKIRVLRSIRPYDAALALFRETAQNLFPDNNSVAANLNVGDKLKSFTLEVWKQELETRMLVQVWKHDTKTALDQRLGVVLRFGKRWFVEFKLGWNDKGLTLESLLGKGEEHLRDSVVHSCMTNLMLFLWEFLATAVTGVPDSSVQAEAAKKLGELIVTCLLVTNGSEPKKRNRTVSAPQNNLSCRRLVRFVATILEARADR